MSVLLEFSMVPLGQGESVSASVARSLGVISKSGLPYKLNPMGTVIEGEWDEVMQVVKDCFATMSDDNNRISTSIKIDYRAGQTGRIESKIKSLENKLGKSLRT